MSRRVVLRQATRVEGNARIHVEIEDGRVVAARFVVPDFRGFEKMAQGCPVEHAPGLISRICGLCSAAHQVASCDAIERALGIAPPPALATLREILVLGERIASHALAYFFLAMPDWVDAPGGIVALARTRPDLMRRAATLREGGQTIVRAIGKRAVHPVSSGIGRFLVAPAESDLEETRRAAREVHALARRLILEAVDRPDPRGDLAAPADHSVNLLAFEDGPDGGRFGVYGRDGHGVISFDRGEFQENVAELRADWTLGKFPYLAPFGFPAGIVLVGPAARAHGPRGILHDPEIAALGVLERLSVAPERWLERIDLIRLVEIFTAARDIVERLEALPSGSASADGPLDGSGRGLGVLEAPRGVLVHDYCIDRGRVERLRLLVATQFNNAYLNLLVRDLSARHVEGDRITPEGERLIDRSIRLFDPCLSCASH